jgi:short-subunit dehydrogenase
MVFTVEVSAFAHVPLDAAVAYVADFRNAPEWQRGLTAVQVDGPFPLSRTVVEVRRFLGRRIEAPGELIAWDADTGFTVRGHSGPLRVESRYGFASEADGTRITLHLTMAGRGVARLAEPLLRHSITGELRAAFQRLGSILNGQQMPVISPAVNNPAGRQGRRDPQRQTGTSAIWRRLGTAAAGLAAARLAVRMTQSPDDLQGKAALVTGASRGLGLLIARELAARGCRLALCARTAADLDRAARDLRDSGATVVTMACDISDQAQAEDFVRYACEQLGSADILVNNAGAIRVGPLRAMTPADFDEALGVMFWGTVYTTLATLKYMRDQHDGSIVNIASIGGRIGVPHLLPYTCAKFAVVGFSEGLRTEVADDGIRVTTVLPSLLRTGSHIRAGYKGDPAREFTWFAVGSSVPVVSMDAERAARRIVAVMRRGRAELILPSPAIVATWLHGLSPAAMGTALRYVNRLLPQSADGTAGSDNAAVGGLAIQEQLESRLLRRATRLNDEAARRFNQLGGQ